MSAANNGGPAFPMQDAQAINAYAAAKSEGIQDVDERDRIYIRARAEAVGGMTLRDYFAAKAMQASMSTARGASAEAAIEKAAETAYKVADAMLKARDA